MSTQPQHERTAAQSLMIWLRGWRKGATASAYDDRQVADPDFWPGYQVGRASQMHAYGEGCKLYGTTLSPLRESEALSQPTPQGDPAEVKDDPLSKTHPKFDPFRPRWPEGLEAGTLYEIPCDDQGCTGGCWLRVMVANDGDVWVSMQEWPDVPKGKPDPLPSIRIRTLAGGGRNQRTRQALLWLAKAMELDQQDPL
jgi:hypothetical protein